MSAVVGRHYADGNVKCLSASWDLSFMLKGLYTVSLRPSLLVIDGQQRLTTTSRLLGLGSPCWEYRTIG